MEYWLASKELNLSTIPDLLAFDFEQMILESYFEGIHDLYNLTDSVDLFAVHAHSDEETGSPFTLVRDEEWMEEHSKDVIADGFFDVLSDVAEVLNFHRLFHCWKDIGGSEYEFVGEFFNMPIKQVW